MKIPRSFQQTFPAILPTRPAWEQHGNNKCFSLSPALPNALEIARKFLVFRCLLPCHGRGREFESRRPRHFFSSS
jgi:hypothetical protein